MVKYTTFTKNSVFMPKCPHAQPHPHMTHIVKSSESIQRTKSNIKTSEEKNRSAFVGEKSIRLLCVCVCVCGNMVTAEAEEQSFCAYL